VILDYLARETGHFEGRTEQQRWQARKWLSWEADPITAVARVRHTLPEKATAACYKISEQNPTMETRVTDLRALPSTSWPGVFDKLD
jgi:glutathione S-transferase